MSKTKPCPECWVEAQRREAAYGEDPDAAYVRVLTICPLHHDATDLPAGAGDPFAPRDTATPDGGGSPVVGPQLTAEVGCPFP